MKNYLLVALLFIAGFGFAQIPYGTYEVGFSPLESAMGNEVDLNDDQYSAKIAIGFPFRYFGTDYDSLQISSNGYITFRSVPAMSFSSFSVANSIPFSGVTPQGDAAVNSIFLTW
jgi:hypothetical protein